MQVEVPDELLRKAQANTGDVLLAVAVQFYADNRIEYEDALRLAAMAPNELNRELVRRGISLQLYPNVQSPRRHVG
jgi:predicted HTH domain antitoxin